jgi:hypothetical protein
VLAVLVNVVLAFNTQVTPSLEDAEPVIAGGMSGAFLTGQRGGLFYIYSVDNDGIINAVYKDTGGSGARITHLAEQRGNLYFLRESDKWQLVEISADLKPDTVREIYQSDYQLISHITELSASLAGWSITGVSAGGRTAYSLKLTETNLESPVLDVAVNSPLDNPIVIARAGDNSIYALLRGGEAVRINRNNDISFISDSSFAVVDFGSVTELKLPFTLRIKMLEFPPLAHALPMLILSLMLIAAAGFMIFTKKIATRTTAGFAVSLLLIFFVMAELQIRNTENISAVGQLNKAQGQSALISNILDGRNYTELSSPHFFTTDEYTVLAEYFGDTGDNSRRELVFVTPENQMFTIISERFPYGTPAENIFSKRIMQAVNIAVETESPEDMLAGETAYSIVPVFYGGRVYALVVTSVSQEAVSGIADPVRYEYMKNGLLFITAAILVIFLLNRGLTKPLRRIIKRIERYSEGVFETDSKVKSKGDVGAMERAISEMGVSLAISEYETKTTVNSFYRFVPCGIEKLLGRAGIAEISSGDVVSVKDNLCILSVENREKAQGSTDDRGFMSFVNNCFSLVYEQVQRQNGMLLSSDFNLSALPILFPENDGASAGIRFGMDLMDISETNPNDEEGLQPDFFLMLHHTKFLYGVAGTEEKAFPFLSSNEMNFLSSHANNLRSLGTRIIMTEQYLNNLPESASFTHRFIGFISSPDGRFSYKLHEVLDCYSDAERALLRGYGQKFQKAISLFLKNDFYLARGEFSAILRSNPNDGIARWYVFACEHFFNSNDLMGVAYNLFGIAG